MTTPLDDAPDLCRLSAPALAAGFQAGQFSPVEVARACLQRAHEVQARCNAFVRIDEQGALAAARQAEARWHAGMPAGPLDGVPGTIKDIVLIAGQPVSYGTRAQPPVVAAEDSPAVALLRAAGIVFLGQTTTPEFGWKAVTDSPGFGITRNPWDPGLTSGGSSGGAAVAAAMGAGVLHLGTDGGGSIRVPASFCHVVGHKPSFGRVPAAPASPFGTVAHLGPITRTAADAALMLDALSGRDPRDWHQNVLPFPPTALANGTGRDLAGLRVGIWADPPGGSASLGVAAEVARVFADCLALLEDAGARLRPIVLPMHDTLADLFRIHWFAGAAQRLRGLDRAGIDPGLCEVADAGAAIPLADYLAATTQRAAFGAAMDRLMQELDVIVAPAVSITPFAAGRETPEGSGMTRWTDWAGFSYPVNLWQAPACVVPTATSMIGLQIIAARGDDATALAVAAAWQARTASAITARVTDALIGAGAA